MNKKHIEELLNEYADAQDKFDEIVLNMNRIMRAIRDEAVN